MMFWNYYQNIVLRSCNSCCNITTILVIYIYLRSTYLLQNGCGVNELIGARGKTVVMSVSATRLVSDAIFIYL